MFTVCKFMFLLSTETRLEYELESSDKLNRITRGLWRDGTAPFRLPMPANVSQHLHKHFLSLAKVFDSVKPR